jgi:plastocyanin
MSQEPGVGRRRAWRAVIVLVSVPALVLLVLSLRTPAGEEVVIEVPLGTSARITAGEDVVLLPGTLSVSVGDTLEIRNLDVTAHEVGPYQVAAGQTLRQTFTEPGTIHGTCSLNPMGEVTIEVG